MKVLVEHVHSAHFLTFLPPFSENHERVRLRNLRY